jgi:hypothetical protein
MFAGENSLARLRERGWPMWTAALISKIERISTREAEEIVEAGGLEVDGQVVKGYIEDIREGAVITVQGERRYRIGHPGPDAYGGPREATG